MARDRVKIRTAIYLLEVKPKNFLLKARCFMYICFCIIFSFHFSCLLVGKQKGIFNTLKYYYKRVLTSLVEYRYCFARKYFFVNISPKASLLLHWYAVHKGHSKSKGNGWKIIFTDSLKMENVKILPFHEDKLHF